MASEKVEIIFAANDAEVIRALQRQNRELDKQVQKLQGVADRSKRATRQQTQDNESVVKGLVNIGLAATNVISVYGGISTALRNVTTENRKLIQQGVEVNKVWSEAFNRFQVQAGLNDLQKAESQKRVAAIAHTVAAPIEVATDAATQLVSSGFSAEEASGGSLESFLKVLAATNQTGQNVDAKTLAESFAKYLNANRMDKTGENILAVGKAVQSLFQGTNMQISGLSPLAAITGAIADQTTFKEQLAAQSTLLESFDASQSAIGLRNFVSILSGAAANDVKVTALQKMGIAPEQVDFVGENMGQVLDVLAQGFASLKEEDRAVVSQKLFEREGAQFGNFLIANRETYKRFLEIQEDDSSFNTAYRNATTGRGAAERRQTIRRDEAMAGADQQSDLFLGAMEAEFAQANTPAIVRAVNRWLYEGALGFNQTPEQAVETAAGGVFNPQSRVVAERVSAQVERDKGNTFNAFARDLLLDLFLQAARQQFGGAEQPEKQPSRKQQAAAPANEDVAMKQLQALQNIERKIGQQPPQATQPQAVRPQPASTGGPQEVKVINQPASGARRPIKPASAALSK